MKYSICLLLLAISYNALALPRNFVYLNDIDPSIIQDIRYSTPANFVGRPLKGYKTSKCILTREAALALSKIQQQLKKQFLSLKVYDCYRPQMTVNDFIEWSYDSKDQKLKSVYYPNVNKIDFFKLGYVAKRSSHTRGSTVDLTIVNLLDPKQSELDMGTNFDFMDERSHALTKQIHNRARSNRFYLRSVMQQGGYVPYDKEWWHFTLQNEPYADTYFNFLIT